MSRKRAWLMKRTIKSRARKATERLIRARILSNQQLPRGIDVFVDLRKDLPGVMPRVVFDVGANVGGATSAYLAAFPEAEIYSFEPAAKTFAQLSRRFDAEPRVHCFQLAMSVNSTEGTLMVDESLSTLASLSETAYVTEKATALEESVVLESLDRFTRTQQIDQIDFLKVETVGHELEALRGAEQLLRSGAIDLVEVEVGMHPQKQVPIEILKRHLEDRGYSLFGIYEQVPEWTLRKPHLRRANAVFVSAQVIAAHDAV